MIKIYKNLMPEEERLRCLEIIESMPELSWAQSIRTDASVEQLTDYMPLRVYSEITKVYEKIYKRLEAEFLIKLKDLDFNGREHIAVDRRTTGYSLPKHNDFPTGEFSYLGDQNSKESKIAISSVFYWNDGFSGGEIYFEDELFKCRPEPGDLVVFNSEEYHEVLEIKSGVRYSTQYIFEKI